MTERQNFRKIHCTNVNFNVPILSTNENVGKKVGPRLDYMNRTMKVREFKKFLKVKAFITKQSATHLDRIVKEVSGLLGQKLFTVNDCKPILCIHNSYAYVVLTYVVLTNCQLDTVIKSQTNIFNPIKT